MLKNLLLGLMISLPINAEELVPIYQLNLKKSTSQLVEGETQYQFVVTRPNSFSEFSPDQNLINKLRDELQIFAVKGLKLESNSHIEMDVELKDDLYLVIKFENKLPIGTAAFSCFQDWYLKLNHQDRFLLSANLMETDPEIAITELQSFQDSYINHLQQNYQQCSILYDKLVINNDTGAYLYTGFSLWFNHNINHDYRNFQIFLEPSRASLRQYHSLVNPNPYIVQWLNQVKKKAMQFETLSKVDDIFFADDVPSNPATFILNALRWNSTKKQIEDFLETGVIDLE